MSAPTIVVNAGEPQTPPKSNDSAPSSQTQERNEAMQLGAVLEAHRATQAEQAETRARLDRLESETQAFRSDFGNQMSGVMGRLDQLLTAQVETAEEVADVEEVIADEPPPAEEPPPAKKRSGWHQLIFG